jgi:alcohol dehydrogenase class IV
MSDIRAFSAPTRIVAGLGALDRLAGELQALGARKVAVVCDEGVASAGLLDGVLAAMGTDAVVTLPFVQPDPLVADVETCAGVAQTEGCDAVVGLGGGSALALAKAVALLLANDSPITRYAGWGARGSLRRLKQLARTYDARIFVARDMAAFNGYRLAPAGAI